jgi:DNA-directed RNA polymerase specialized sigma24 family protein
VEMLEAFPNEESMYRRLNPFDYNDMIAELEEELKKEFWRVIETCLTDRQKNVIRLYADGYTQMEIAKILNVNQSSITKSIHGNVDYKKQRKAYGGSRRKLKKIVENDDKIKEILRRISELRDESWG